MKKKIPIIDNLTNIFVDDFMKQLAGELKQRENKMMTPRLATKLKTFIHESVKDGATLGDLMERTAKKIHEAYAKEGVEV